MSKDIDNGQVTEFGNALKSHILVSRSSWWIPRRECCFLKRESQPFLFFLPASRRGFESRSKRFSQDPLAIQAGKLGLLHWLAKMLVFILAGQSNMAGRGVEEKDSSAVGNDAMLALQQGSNPVWKPAEDPLHEWVDSDELRSKCSSYSRSKPGTQFLVCRILCVFNNKGAR
jgi:hypothetical protein